MLANALRAVDRRRYVRVVVCPPGASAEMFRDTGAEVHTSPHPIRIIPHVSAYSFPAWSPAFIAGALGQWMDRGYWQRFIAAQHVDLVHLNSLALAPLASAARAAHVPVVCLVQETFADGLLGLRSNWLKRVLSTQLDGVWFVSDYDRRQARATTPVIDVIPHWTDIDPSVDRAVARAALGLDADADVILSWEAFHDRKGR